MKDGLTLTSVAARFLLLKLDLDNAKDEGRRQSLIDQLELRPDEVQVLDSAFKAHRENLRGQVEFYEKRLR